MIPHKGIASAQGAREFVSMTLTERKRRDHPERYIRKDARKRIYRELYGRQGELKGKRSNNPAEDETRGFNSFWTHQGAVSVFNQHANDAVFTQAEYAECERRLDLLKRFKPHGVIEA